MVPNELYIDSKHIPLTTFSSRIELQPISTHITLLELIANDLYRRRDYPMIAGEIKQAGKDLRATMARYTTWGVIENVTADELKKLTRQEVEPQHRQLTGPSQDANCYGPGLTGEP